MASPQYETILYSVSDGIATLTFNRPTKRNALDLPMRREIASAVQHASRDEDVRVLILTGAGGHFCSGGDIASMQARKPGADAGRQRMRDNWDFVQELAYLGKPVIAAVDGSAVGAGFSLALTADFILASDRAYFCFSFAKIGLVPDLGAMYLLPRVVGLQAAKDLVYSARNVPAAEAKAMGIAYRVLPPDALMPEAIAMARKLTLGSPAAMGMAKSVLNSSYQTDLRTVLDLEASANGIGFETDYHKDAIGRFLRKEPFVFQSFTADDPLDNPAGGKGA